MRTPKGQGARLALALLLVLQAVAAHGQRGMDNINMNGQLLVAARSNNVARAQELLAAGAEVNSRDRNGDSALNLAASRGNVELAEAMLAAKADVNLANIAGVTPLMGASFAGNGPLVRRLLAAGARVEPVDRIKKTAATYAAAQGCSDCLLALLQAGTDVNVRLDAQLTLLMWASGPDEKASETEAINVVSFLLDAGAHIDDRDARGRTALMIAAEGGRAEIASLLLARGADPSLKDKAGKSAADLTVLSSLRERLTPP